MAIAIIKRYLAQTVHNYNEGRVLFERYSDDKVLTLLFRSGSSSYHHRRLIAALEELSEKDEVIPQISPAKEADKPVIPTLDQFDVPVKKIIDDGYHSFPESMQEVIRTKNMHYRRAQQLYIEIGFTEDKDKRLEMALTMLDDHQKVNECWSVIDEYKETGKILVEKSKSLEEEVSSIPDARIGQSIANINSNLSKDKKKLEQLPDGAKKAKVLLRYQTNKIKLDLLRKRLSLIDGEGHEQ